MIIRENLKRCAVPRIQWVTGVYVIRNKVNGKEYIGSAATSLKRRWKGHTDELKTGKHRNRYLQNAWNKYGANNFEFIVVERCPPDLCLIREQFWLDEKKTYVRSVGYNIAITAGSNLGLKFVYKPRDPEVHARIASKLRGRKLSPAHREKCRLANLGRKQSAETIEKRTAKLRGRKRPAYIGQKIAAIHRGKKRSAEARANISRAQKLRFQDAEQRRKAGQANIGRRLTDEHKSKIRVGNLRPDTVKRKSENTKRQFLSAEFRLLHSKRTGEGTREAFRRMRENANG